MLVDLARNDIARISKPATRHVTDLLKVDRYSHVMHLVSRVVGNLRADLDALHAYQACMNMGTLTGAPKIKASELIRKVEKSRRGRGGAIAYLNSQGDMDTCIIIRSAFVKITLPIFKLAQESSMTLFHKLKPRNSAKSASRYQCNSIRGGL